MKRQDCRQKKIHSAQQTDAIVKNLQKATQEIAAFSQQIKDIAEQTHLLSFKIAIEAGRAGEAGRGFAIVAQEIRTLSNKTSETTKDIAKIIDDIQPKWNMVRKQWRGDFENKHHPRNPKYHCFNCRRTKFYNTRNRSLY